MNKRKTEGRKKGRKERRKKCDQMSKCSLKYLQVCGLCVCTKYYNFQALAKWVQHFWPTTPKSCCIHLQLAKGLTGFKL